MDRVYEDYLFSQGYFVAQTDAAGSAGHPAEALAALSHLANIHITEGANLACLHMVEVAQRNLGFNVPEPFYRGFPASVRELTPNQLLLDQLVHYFSTYGMGDFSKAGHSLLEELYARTTPTEQTEPKLFAIISQDKASAVLAQAVTGFLSSTRPLSDANYSLLLRYVRDTRMNVGACASKDTACRLLIDLRDPKLARLLELPDVIRLVEWILKLNYVDARLNKMNLRNKDRKLITHTLDELLEHGSYDVTACLEKRRAWTALLHHVHYQPKSNEARAFCSTLRQRATRSAYSRFEQHMRAGNVYAAADALREDKGPTAVLRNLTYLLSRCKSTEEMDHILDIACDANRIALVQLITHLFTASDARRAFRFVHLGCMCVHTETDAEASHRRSLLSEETKRHAISRLTQALERTCHGTLGRVYVSEAMRNVALPLQDAASQGGFATLPRGTRIPLPDGKTLRAFVYWEGVDDIDLSCFGLSETGDAQEFSWRTMAGLQSEGIAYSGDQTSGFNGGSEYFDVEPTSFMKLYPRSRYVVFCANVYTWGATFSRCLCRAGYMLRDTPNSGEVFEPKTVQSSFAVGCASSSAFLFALDLVDGAFVWLNIAMEGKRRVAGTGSMAFLLPYMRLTDAMSLYDFARMLATEVVEDPHDANTVFSDEPLVLESNQEQIRSRDTARIIQLLNA